MTSLVAAPVVAPVLVPTVEVLVRPLTMVLVLPVAASIPELILPGPPIVPVPAATILVRVSLKLR